MNHTKISKKLSFILRHKPEQFGISHDRYGYMSISLVLKALKVNLDVLKDIVNTDMDGRYSIHGDKIRALSGHSFPVELEIEPSPPIILYHGTPTKNIDSIMQNGINSGNRTNVHLTRNLDTAKIVAKRHSKDITIFEIDTVKALNNGVIFYKGNKKSVLSTLIPCNCLRIKH